MWILYLKLKYLVGHNIQEPNLIKVKLLYIFQQKMVK
jgi:hypothetical protein